MVTGRLVVLFLAPPVLECLSRFLVMVLVTRSASSLTLWTVLLPVGTGHLMALGLVPALMTVIIGTFSPRVLLIVRALPATLMMNTVDGAWPTPWTLFSRPPSPLPLCLSRRSLPPARLELRMLAKLTLLSLPRWPMCPEMARKPASTLLS